jgi:8-oxo-dGTP diphosphatase
MDIIKKNRSFGVKMDYPRVGVALILEKDGQVLLVRRQGAHGAGTWATPGGHLDFGESPAECAVRELKEEVSITAFEPEFLAITNDVFKKEDKHYITIWMKAEKFKGEPIIASRREVAELGWFRWEDLPTPRFLPLQNLLDQHCLPSNSIFKKKN